MSRAGAVFRSVFGRSAGMGALALALGGCFADFPAPAERVPGGDGDMPDTASDGATGRFDGGKGEDTGASFDASWPADSDFEDEGPPALDRAVTDGPIDLAVGVDMAPEVDMAPDVLPEPDMTPAPPELCNGLDDDGNGVVDDAPVCGQVIASRCRIFLGWGDNNRGPGDGEAQWGGCPESDTDDFAFLDPIACRGTRRDGRFRALVMPDFYNVDSNDDIGIAFICDGGPPEVTPWVQSACAVWIGQADNEAAAGQATWDDWGGCLAGGLAPGWGCESSGGDGVFHRMSLQGDVNNDDDFAIAFRCVDEADPARAAAAQASAAAILGWTLDAGSIADGGDSWGECPGVDNAAQDDVGDVRCASSAFDGRFHRMGVAGEVDQGDAFGIALVAHPDAPPPPPPPQQ